MTTLRRQVKNVIKNYTEPEVKVREATSNDPWGPSSTLMSEISDLTYNIVALGDIMRMIWKRLNDHGKNWRHVYKSLVLLDYLIKNGNEKVAQQCKEHIVAIQTLKDFQYVEENKDQGANVRDKAKQLVSLLRDDERLKQERLKALKARERYAQNAMGISSDNKVTFSTIGAGSRLHQGSSTRSGGNYSDPYGGGRSLSVDNEYTTTTVPTGGANRIPLAPEIEAVRPSDATEEEIQMNLALMLSKQEHEEEVQRKRADEAKLQLAIEQSKLETSTTSQDNGLLDLASGFSSKSNDPWSNDQNNDPWGGAPITTTTTKQTQIVDPWSSTSTNTNDLWSIKPIQSTIPPLQTQTTNPWNTPQITDPWAASALQIPLPKPSNDLDEFELFSNKRVTSPTPAAPSAPVNDPFGDFFGNTSTTTTPSNTNPWNDKTTNSFETNKTRKTPESFLGENSSLVNLENLIPTTGVMTGTTNNNNANNRPKSTNPFGGVQQQLNTIQQSSSANNLINRPLSTTPSTTTTYSNPFSQQVPKAPPMNQLNGNSANLFPSFNNTQFMQQQPTPMIMPQATFPTFNQQQQSPVAAFGGGYNNQQSTNPFL